MGLRCVAAIFSSLRCRRARWRLDANIPCGRASACSFAMLVLLCPASEKAALHSWPDNASLACLHASIVLYSLVSYAGVSTPSEPKDSNSRPLCMIANSYFARLRMQHICKREGERSRVARPPDDAADKLSRVPCSTHVEHADTQRAHHHIVQSLLP